MSDDTDDPEGFDREAQRRELREKYAADREDRERTGRMSELLLQGATMTNKHCDRCGNPIFRYDGAEFCPTCRAEDDAAAAAEASADPDGVAGDDTSEVAGAVTGDDVADASAAAGEADTAGTGRETNAEAGEDDAITDELAERHEVAKPPEGTNEDAADRPAASPPSPPASADANAPSTGSAARSPARETVDVDGPTGGSEAVDDDVAAARAALSQSVARLADRAASADPHTARELAEAAREAAEALAALDR